MKAYKVFNSDWTCKGKNQKTGKEYFYQYKIGETYELQSDLILCENGFHACKKAVNCFNYYSFDPKNKVAEVELLGDIVEENGDKQATNKIKIVREITWNELLTIVNTGEGNTGKSNSGDRNSGDRNSGNWNSGNRNSGNWNSGDQNSGNRNSGDRNSGKWNSGDQNSGNRNSGDQNSGNWNSGNWNSGKKHNGDWNTGNPEKVYFFNQLITYSKYQKIVCSTAYLILRNFYLIKYRVRTVTGKFGDYRYLSYKESFRVFWSNLSREEKQIIISMPYFNRDIFFEITGVKL